MKINYLKLQVVYIIVGIAVFIVSNIFRNQISDFVLGFCEGISIVLVLLSSVTIIYKVIKNKKAV